MVCLHVDVKMIKMNLILLYSLLQMCDVILFHVQCSFVVYIV